MRTIRHLFTTEKRIQPYKLYADEYYKSYWFNKEISDGIDLVAAIERISNNHAAFKLIHAGFLYYFYKLSKNTLRCLPQGWIA